MEWKVIGTIYSEKKLLDSPLILTLSEHHQYGELTHERTSVDDKIRVPLSPLFGRFVGFHVVLSSILSPSTIVLSPTQPLGDWNLK